MHENNKSNDKNAEWIVVRRVKIQRTNENRWKSNITLIKKGEVMVSKKL